MLRASLLLTVSAPLRVGCGLALTVAAATALPIAAQAQQDDFDDPSGAVVQSLPNNDALNLNGALARLGQNPRDSQALIDAGQAALAIGDIDAAIGFFSRADQVMPGNPRVKTGLARALVRNGNPYDAIPLFLEAEKAGAMDGTVALDRGLAYDLVADNASAQRLYRQALAGGRNDEASRRLAISLAIAGDRRGSGTALSSLLLRDDKASQRARAFSLAILGQADEAIAVINATLPAQLAAGIAPYLRYMPRLTPAQQAAAANFGQFPRASEIGRDDPRVATYATNNGRRTALASADSGLIPRGEQLGRNSRNRENRSSNRQRESRNDRQRPPEIAVAAPAAPRVTNDRRTAVSPPQPVRGTIAAPAPLLSASGPGTPLLPTQTLPPRPVVQAVPPPLVPQGPPIRPVTVAVAPRSPQPVAGPTDTTRLPTMPTMPAPSRPAIPVVAPQVPRTVAAVVVPPASMPALIAATPPPAVSTPDAAALAPPVQIVASRPAPPIAPTPRRQSLSEVFSDFGGPVVDATPASGAVDIRRIRPAREPASGTPAAGPVVPSHPSRIWVQVATGRDKVALSFDWRRMARQAEAVFKSRRPQVSAWGQTNRLLAGPFESEAAANQFMGQLRRADIDGAFTWTSPAGQVVDALSAR